MTRLILAFLFSIFCLPSMASESVDPHEFVISAGTIGPMVMLQGGLSLQSYYQMSEKYAFDIEWATYSIGGNLSPANQVEYVSSGISYFISDMPLIRKIGVTRPVFTHLAYSYHDEKKFDRLGGKIIGREISHGLEVSSGVLLRESWYSLVLEPVVLYFPLSKNESGEPVGHEFLDRVLMFRFGVVL